MTRRVRYRQAATKPGSVLLVVLFAGMAFSYVTAPVVGVPWNSLFMGGVVALGIFKFRGGARLPLWVFAVVLAVPGWLIVATLLNGGLNLQRIISVALYASTILIIASGRIEPTLIGRGLGIAVLIAVVLGLVGPFAGSYGPRLTGPLGDPNSAGFSLAVLTALALPSLSNGRQRAWLVAIGGLGIVLTDSRTSIVAMLVMIFWVCIFRFGLLWVSFVAILVPIVWVPASNLLDVAYADRSGSDLLRARISALEQLDVARSPIFGNGAGTARIMVGGNEFFYHNSYLAIRAEGGWIGLGFVVLLLAVILITLLRLPRSQRNPLYESAIFAIVICAANIGAVLLTLTAAVAIGTALRHVLASRNARNDRSHLVLPPSLSMPRYRLKEK